MVVPWTQSAVVHTPLRLIYSVMLAVAYLLTYLALFFAYTTTGARSAHHVHQQQKVQHRAHARGLRSAQELSLFVVYTSVFVYLVNTKLI